MATDRGDVNRIVSRAQGSSLPIGVYEFEFAAIPTEQEFELEKVKELFVAHGFTAFAPRNRHVKTLAQRAMQRATGQKRGKVKVVDDLVFLPETQRIDSGDDIGADVELTRRERVRITETGDFVTSDEFAPAFEAALRRQQQVVWGADVRNNVTAIVEGIGIRKRPGEWYIANDEGSYVETMRQVAQLVTDLGGRFSITPIHNEEDLFLYVIRAAERELTQEFRETLEEIKPLLEEEHKPRRDTKIKMAERYSALMSKARFYVEDFALYSESLASIVSAQGAALREAVQALASR